MTDAETKLAFVDIDTQVDFVEPSGKLYATGAEAIKRNLSRLIQHAQSTGIPLVSSVDAHEEGDDEFSEFPPHCLRGTPGQERVQESQTGAEVFVPSAPSESLPDPKSTHVVLEKQQFSVFSNPVAEQIFAATEAKTFVVFGVVTEVCVRFAVLGLLERGYTVRVVEDAIWPIDAANGETALQEMQGKGAVLVKTADVLGDVLVADVEIVEDRTAASTCEEGFLKVRRYTLRNTYTDGRISKPYACDVLSRRSVDAVAVVLWHRDPKGTVHVHYREATRPPIWLRRHKQDELPFKDPHPFDTIGEIVAGVLEVGDDGPEGVRRRGAIETKEEAGYDVPLEAVTFLGSAGLFPSPGVTDEKIYLCAAEIDPSTRGAAEGDGSVLEEGTRMLSLPLREAIIACRRGEIPDTKTELGILRLADHLGYVPQLDLFKTDLAPELQARFDSLGV
jgi:ADP-ribose pyrophosphatase